MAALICPKTVLALRDLKLRFNELGPIVGPALWPPRRRPLPPRRLGPVVAPAALWPPLAASSPPRRRPSPPSRCTPPLHCNRL